MANTGSRLEEPWTPHRDAALDARADLDALFRTHDVAPELVPLSGDLDEMLDRLAGLFDTGGADPARAGSLVRLAGQAAATLERQRGIGEAMELLDTLGLLSHKINNPLTSLLGRAQILRLKPGLDPQVLRAAEVIEESAQRIAALVRELAQLVRAGRERHGSDGASAAR